MIACGDCFVKMGIDKDQPESKQNYENFFNFSNDLKNEVVIRSVNFHLINHLQCERLTKEIIPLLKEYKKEMEFLIVIIIIDSDCRDFVMNVPAISWNVIITIKKCRSSLMILL